MNRTDIVKMASNRAGVSQAQVNKVLEAVCEAVSLSLSCGETVGIRGFGKFHTRQRSASVRKNPRTGLPMHIPNKVSVGFTASTNLRSRLNDEEA